jgi:hypothetical protein
MSKTKLLILLVGALLAMPLAAQNSSDLYVIPVASHTSGQFGTQWMSDLAIQNTQSGPLTVQLIFIESGEGNPNNIFPVTTTNTTGAVTIPAGGNVLLKDVLNGYRGFGSTVGSLLVGGDKPFALTSRSYSMTPAGNTIGQTVPPAANFIDNTVGVTNNQTAIAYLPGLINNAQFRTNIGFVAGNGSSSGQPMSVQVTVRNAAGSAVGTRAFTIPGGAFTHVQFSIGSVAPPSFDIAGAEVTITQGNGAVVPYASVIDNGSADAVFVLGQFPANAPFAGKTASSSVFRDLFIRMTQ